MVDEDKTKEQPIKELVELRQQIAELKASGLQRKQMEDTLRKSEKRFRELTESLPEAVYEMNIEGNLTFINCIGFETSGYSQEDLDAGLNVFQIIVPEDHERLKENLIRIINGEDIGINEYMGQRKDGCRFPVIIHSTVIRDDEGKPVGVRGVTVNIAERKRAEEALLESSRAVLKYHEFKDTARSIFDSCKNLTGATTGYVALLSEDGTKNEVLFLDSGGRPCTIDSRLPMPIQGLCAEAYRAGKAFYHNDFSNSEWVKYMPAGHVRFDNVLFAPLVIKEKMVGLLGLANKPRGFTEKDAQMASAFGELISVALYNSKILELLKNSEECFKSVVQTANDAIISIDSRGNIILWNHAAETIFGYLADEMIGKPLNLIIPERFREAYQKGMNRVIPTEKPRFMGKTVEYSGLRKDGSEFPAEFSLATWKTSEGTFFTAIVRDITERKYMERQLKEYTENLEKLVEARTSELMVSEKRYRGLYESSIDGIASVTMDGKIVEVNQALADMLGYTKEELYQLKYQELIPSKWYDRTAKIPFEQLRKRGYSDAFEIEAFKKDGTLIPVSVSAWLIKNNDDTPTGVWGIVRDITEKKKLDQMKSQFINVAAHELRTPLSALKAHIDILKIKSERGYWGIPEEVNEKINVIARNADRLVVLVNNLLDLTRLEAGTVKLKLELGALDTLVIQVVREVLPLAKKHGHTLTLHSLNMLPSIYMDTVKIHTIFSNLLSNAIKYTPDGGKIDVTILEDDVNLHVIVKDTGIGIAEEDLEKIFQPFHVADIPEADRFQSEFERTGLGLAITKEYVKMHGGSVWAESRIGEGSAFHVIFPKKRD